MMSLATAVAVPAMVVPFAQNVEASTTQFKDISKSSPYYEAVTEMVSKGIIFGYNDGTYKPGQKITRVQVAMLLARAVDLKPVRDAKEFKDVPKTYKHHDAIQKVQQAGIIDGGSNGKFNPDAELTRSQMAKILAIAFNLEVKADYDFPDVPTSHWANKHVRALYSNGITVGNNGMYEPNESVTRGQYALFMHRLMNVDEDFVADPIPKPGDTKPPVVKPEQPKPEQPKPEQPGDSGGHKPGDVVDGGVTQKPVQPEDNPDGIKNGLITEDYTDLTKLPKPAGYVVGVSEKKNEKVMTEIATEFGYKNKSEMTVNNMILVDQRLIDNSKMLNISIAQLVSVINKSIETGATIETDTFGVYYNFQKQVAVFVY